MTRPYRRDPAKVEARLKLAQELLDLHKAGFSIPEIGKMAGMPKTSVIWRLSHHGMYDKSHKALWLVRCRCGDFESRTARSICNPRNSGDRCDECRNLVHLKRREAYLRNPTAPQSDSLSDF